MKPYPVGRQAKATFITFFVYLCSTNVELVTKPNLDNNKQIYLNLQLLLTCVVLSLEYYVSYRTIYSGDHADWVVAKLLTRSQIRFFQNDQTVFFKTYPTRLF